MTDPSTIRDGNTIDHWYIGSPQIDEFDIEYSEFFGSMGVPVNSIDRPGTSIEEKELAFGSHHDGGCHLCLADGSVRFVSENIGRDVRLAIGSLADGEVTGEF